MHMRNANDKKTTTSDDKNIFKSGQWVPGRPGKLQAIRLLLKWEPLDIIQIEGAIVINTEVDGVIRMRYQGYARRRH